MAAFHLPVGKQAQSVFEEWSSATPGEGLQIQSGPVVFSSDNPAVAIVDSGGIVTGVAKGTCIIKATDSVANLFATATVVVVDAESARLRFFSIA